MTKIVMTTKRPPTKEPAMMPIFGEASPIRLETGSLEEEITSLLIVEGDGRHGVVD